MAGVDKQPWVTKQPSIFYPEGVVSHRPGFSLLEVIIAGTIFFMSLVAIATLVLQANQHALAASAQAVALGLAQAKLAEIEAGSISLDQNQDAQELEDAPGFYWSMQAAAPSFSNGTTMPNSIDFKSVTITISQKAVTGEMVDCCSLTQLIVDPARRGNALDPAAITAAQSSSSSGGSSTSGTGGN